MPSKYRTVPPQTARSESKYIDLSNQVTGSNTTFTLDEPLNANVTTTFLTVNGLVSLEGIHYIISENRAEVEILDPPLVDDNVVIYIV